MLILLRLIHHKFFKSNIFNYCRVLVCLFNKICIKLLKVFVCLFNKTYIKLSKNADSARAELTVNLNSQYARVEFITNLKSQ